MLKDRENKCLIIVNKHRKPGFACSESKGCLYLGKPKSILSRCRYQGDYIAWEYGGDRWIECTNKRARIDAAKKAENDIAEEIIEMEEESD